MKKKVIFFFLATAFFTFLLVNKAVLSAPGKKIIVDASVSLGPISRFITGVNLNLRPFIYVGDKRKEELLDKIAPFAKEMGIGSIRFPNGQWADSYDWKNGTIRDCKEKEDLTIAQVANFAKVIGAEVLYVLNMAGAHGFNQCHGFPGRAKDAADLVEYLNIPNDGSNPNRGINWARVRASPVSYCQEIGVNPRLCVDHPEPFNLKYFELGNEPWLAGVDPEKYGEIAKGFAQAMRAVDSNIHLTLVLQKLGGALNTPGLKELVNGGQWHEYSDDLFHSYEERMREIKDKGLDPALTEWNYWCFSKYFEPPGWEHTLGHALFVAKGIQSLAVGKAFFGNYHNLNGIWASSFKQRCAILRIENYGGDLSNLSIKTTTPYYGFKLFKDRLGKTRIQDKIEGNPPFSILSSKNENEIFLLVINENIGEEVETTVQFSNLPFDPLAQIKVVTLNAPRFYSEDVSLKDSKITLAEPKRNFSFSYKFPAHSATVFTVEKEGAPPFISLSSGWNQITWPNVSGKKASDIPTECPIAVAKENLWFTPFVRNFGGVNFNFEKGKTYFIKCNQETVWRL